MLHIDFRPQTEAWIQEEAHRQGVAPDRFVAELVEQQMPTAPQGPSAPLIDARARAAIAYLEDKIRRDHTEDPVEIRRSEDEMKELHRALNANRIATGERPVFPG